MSDDHFITKCSNCGGVIVQCRCPGPKQVDYAVCDKCKEAGVS